MAPSRRGRGCLAGGARGGKTAPPPPPLVVPERLLVPPPALLRPSCLRCLKHLGTDPSCVCVRPAPERKCKRCVRSKKPCVPVPRPFVARACDLQERTDVIAARIATLAPGALAPDRERLVEKVGQKAKKFAKKVEAAGRKAGESVSKNAAAGRSEAALLRTLVGQQAIVIRLLREMRDVSRFSARLPVAESDEEDEDVLSEASAPSPATSTEPSVAPSDDDDD
ncbi:MAG: hypothetical protein M1823_004961 [Watsoniomyces obsoletus]|nr:MAG: hypothetical protein M1823_004961 [Watsoniomyces obsoletus]